MKMNHFKRLFNPQNPLRWYYYVLYIFLLFLLVLMLSAILCLLVYYLRDITYKLADAPAYTSRKGFTTLYGLIVTMVATMTGLAGPALAVYWSVKQDKREVTGLTYSLIKEWRENLISESAFNVAIHFENAEKNNQQFKDIKYALYENAQKTENLELRISIRKILNYFEAVAAACHESHVDAILIRRYFESVFFMFYDRLLPYIKTVRTLKKNDQISAHITRELYSDFTNLVESWKRQNQNMLT